MFSQVLVEVEVLSVSHNDLCCQALSHRFSVITGLY